jgi:hypothetical protein
MIGPFMGYQLAIDLNYSDHLSFDEDDFTVPGPGAVRGLQKVFCDFAGHSPAELIMYMVDRQEEEFARLGLEWKGLFDRRRLHAIDCQGLFCETDKYARDRFPTLKSNRVRIKQEFRDPKPAMALFYPPKWGINDAVPYSEYPHEPVRSLLHHPGFEEVPSDAEPPRDQVSNTPARLFEPAATFG